MARRNIGSLRGKRAQKQIEGFAELKVAILSLSKETRKAILKDAVTEGANETLKIMSQLAPENPNGPTRPQFGHGSEHIVIGNPRKPPRPDTDFQDVGPSWDFARHLKFAELGTVNQHARPFIGPTANIMRPRYVRIQKKHLRKAIFKSTGSGRGRPPRVQVGR